MQTFTFDSSRYPTSPGCYLMKDARRRVIYVGKAKNLRRRLASYFQTHQKYWKAKRLAARIAEIEVILVNNETESLILENNLIKQYKPRYNRMLMREDTGYPYIVLTGEEFPRLLPYRKNWFNKQFEHSKAENEEADDGLRFGPYLSTDFRNLLLKVVPEHFQLRVCHPLPHAVCLRYQLKKCSGICARKISAQEYASAVKQAAAVLAYRHTQLLRYLQQRMWTHAEQLEFEQAQKIRDQISALELGLERQIVEQDVPYDQDVLWFGERHVLVMKLKAGMLQTLNLSEFPDGRGQTETCETFIRARYSKASPQELIVNLALHSEELAAALSATNGYSVAITLPKRGVKADLLQLCEKNYRYRVSINTKT